MADLPSILGGMAQGFLDFGKSAVDLFGTGGASIADLIESARTGKVTTKNSDDFRKWLYETDDVKDAAAKGLGTALNGVQAVSDYIPGIGAVTRNPLFNAGQGALGGLADEFKMYGKDYDLGRAGQRAAVGAGGALASTGLADALKGSGNALLKSGTAQGLARGAVGGAIGAGGYTAIDGGSLGDVANSALQGAGMGAALGGTMGALQDFNPARTYDMALTDEEKAARIANAKNMLANEQDPERIAELNNQIKDLGGTLADADMAVNNVMESRIAPGQLGLFDDMPTQTPKTTGKQTALFDQPQDGLDHYGGDIELPQSENINPYAPVNGKLTQAMKDRYWEVMKNADSFGGAIDNELYNKIDQSTLPKGYDKLRQLLDSQMGEDSKVHAELKKGIGTDIPLKADLDKLVEYVYGDEINGKQTFYKDLDESVRLNRKNAPLIGIDAEQAEADARNSARNKLISRAIEKAERKVIDDVVGSGDSDDILYALQNYRRRGIRTGRAGALDTVLSERLGIAPGNTVKVTNVTDSDRLSSGAAGRYARSERNIALSDMNSPEGKVSTMAHERLHSFQNEARPESAGRYDPEVAEAYKQLQKDLGHYYKSNSEIKKRYKRDVDYWARSGEQESRMFQQYLENKGYTDNSAWRKMGGKADEWGNEINPAFDKFIDKLRDLSKRGVALPALTALFGGGALMANQQKDKEEVR